MATATASTSSSATEREGSIPMDTPPTATTASPSIHFVTPTGDSFSVTTCGMPDHLISQCQNHSEGKKIYMCCWEDCGSNSIYLDTACTHISWDHLHLIPHCAIYVSMFWNGRVQKNHTSTAHISALAAPILPKLLFHLKLFRTIPSVLFNI